MPNIYNPNIVTFTRKAMCANIYMYIFREIRIMTRRMQMKDDLKEVVNDWKFAAMVIDR